MTTWYLELYFIHLFLIIKNMNPRAHIREKTEIQMPTHTAFIVLVNRDKSVADFWLCKY